ncbi:hypothetical protein [Pseudomonas sp. NA-150]|uniref:hypothetical protein n=1 Tax=Pseudomonas sp. NA-150 TaxID=3367525 RepID=UPI0037C52339
MAIDQKTLNRNDPAIDPDGVDEDLDDGAKFNEDAPLAADKAQLELDKLHAAAENPFSPDAIPAADSEEERARQRREQGIETDSDINTDGG